MTRARTPFLLGCIFAASASAQPAPAHRLAAPEFTIHPLGGVPALTGQGVSVVVGWRPVPGSHHYRVVVTDKAGSTNVTETTALRIEKQGLAPGHYELTIAATDAAGGVGPTSEPLHINVIEIRAIPPGSDAPRPPTRGAYAIGTRFSVPGMHCQFGDAPIDDLLVGPENEVRMPMAGVATLRCAGIPGYLEKQIIVVPVTVAVHSATVPRGVTTPIHVTLSTVAELGDGLDVVALGDVGLGAAVRTEFGLDIPVLAAEHAQHAGLSIQSGDFELGRIELIVADAPPPAPPPPRASYQWRAVDLGGHVGGLFLPNTGHDAVSIGRPTNLNDAVTSGPLAGVRLGLFPTPRIGLEGEAAMILGGYADDADVARMISTRGQLAIRALESGSYGIRFFAGVGALTTLRDRGTSKRGFQGAIHGGVALTIETSPNLWLRMQITDLATTALDDGYAHGLELQLGVVTRLGRSDAF